jgi:hypothetical protein
MTPPRTGASMGAVHSSRSNRARTGIHPGVQGDRLDRVRPDGFPPRGHRSWDGVEGRATGGDRGAGRRVGFSSAGSYAETVDFKVPPIAMTSGLGLGVYIW